MLKRVCPICGKEFEVYPYEERKGRKYCSIECKQIGCIKDLTGKKFGKLTVIKRIFLKEKGVYWLCKCDCGNEKIVLSGGLTGGGVKSCGCLQREPKPIHNLCHHPLYNILHQIKNRCLNPNIKEYKNYGGRGIKVCQEWLDDFMNFYNWAMANGYKEGLTIDRINFNGNYCPENCRWVDMKTQQRNKRSNILITYKNETHCLSEWEEILRFPQATLCRRLKRGWTIERAIEQPIGKYKKGV